MGDDAGNQAQKPAWEQTAVVEDDAAKSPVLSRLHELEVINKKLSSEKESLEHQLIHVLERYASTSVSDPQRMTKEEVKDIIRETIEEFSVTLSKPPVSTKAPLAQPDYSGLRNSLTESFGEPSIMEYSSLSDAYEELCLNKDIANRIIASESSREIHELGAMPSTVVDEDDTSKTILPTRKFSKALATFSRSSRNREMREMKNLHSSHQFSTPSRRIAKGPDSHTVFYPTVDLSSDSCFMRQAMQTSTSNLSLINVSLRQCAYETDSTQSSAGSCSIFSSSSESFSASNNPSPVALRRSQHTASSLPCSPLATVLRPRAPVSGARPWDFRGTQPHSPQKPIPKITSRDDVIAAMRRLYGLPAGTAKVPTETATASHVRPKGPPKVKIMRKEIKQMTHFDDSSETTSVNSHQGSQCEHFQRTRYQRTRGAPGSAIPSKSSPIKIYGIDQSYQRTPNFAGRPVPLADTSHHREYPSNFMNVLIHMKHWNVHKADDLYEARDFTILESVGRLIDGLDSFTRHRGQCVLLHRLRPPFLTYAPILRSINPSNHSYQSSDLTSEISETLELRNNTQSPVHPISPGTTRSDMTVHASNGQSDEAQACTSTDPVAATEELDDNSILHTGSLYRLSNRVKIWRLCHAKLTLTALAIFSPESSHSGSAKCCIAVSSIRAIRKPHHLSTSITSGLTTKLPTPRARPAKPESVPVTRKFTGTSLHHGDVRTNFGHFELVLSNGKSHRFRGMNAAETDVWLTHIRHTLRINLASELLQQYGAQLVTQGWLRRIKRGETSWIWCRLMGHHLIYFQSPKSRIPSGYKSLIGIHIRTTDMMASLHATHSQLCAPNHLSSDVLDVTNLSLELTSSSDSDILTVNELEQRQRTIALWSDHVDPIYFVCRTRAEFELWRDNLTRACQQFTLAPDSLIDSPTIKSRLMEMWRLLVNEHYFNDLHHTNEPIKMPLSKTTDKLHSQLCSCLFTCLIFLSYPQVECKRPGKSAIPVHTGALLSTSYWLNRKYYIFRFLSEQCFQKPELKDELFLQLIKQVLLSEAQLKRLDKRNFPQPRRRSALSIPLFCADSRSHHVEDERDRRKLIFSVDAANEQETLRVSNSQSAQLDAASQELMAECCIIFPTSGMSAPQRPECWWPVLAIWECLGILLTMFLPSTPVVKCLDLVLIYYSRETSATSEVLIEISRYASFCREMLQQTLKYGGRSESPSALEVASISIRNPYTHKYPFSMPIHLPNLNAYEVVSFNGGSDFNYLAYQIVQKLQLPKPGNDCPMQYAIYLSLYGDKKPKRYLYLRPQWKICDVLSIYERAIMEQHRDQHRKLTLEQVTAEFTFRIQSFCWKRLRKMSTEQVKPALALLTHLLHSDVLAGSYVLLATLYEMTDLVAYLCRIDHQSYTELQRKKEFTLNQLLQNYFPEEVLTGLASSGKTAIQLKLLLLDRWTMLCKSFAHAPERCQTDTEYVKTSFAYLRLLRRLSPMRFGTVAFAAHVYNLPGTANDQVVWLIPQESQLNILTIRTDSDMQSSTTSPRPRIYCNSTIPYQRIQSFGGRSSGALYIIYLEKALGVTERSGTIHRDYMACVDGKVSVHSRWKRNSPPKESVTVRNIQCHLTDLNAVIELTETLNFFFSLSQKPIT